MAACRKNKIQSGKTAENGATCETKNVNGESNGVNTRAGTYRIQSSKQGTKQKETRQHHTQKVDNANRQSTSSYGISSQKKEDSHRSAPAC
jgi:hypothetical protein